MNINSLKYSARVWLSAVVLAPAIYFGGLYLDSTAAADSASAYIMFCFFVMFYEFIFSLITWLVFWIAVELVTWLIAANILRKLILSFIGIGLTFATFRVFPLFDSFSLADNFFALMLINCGCVGIACWCFRPEPKRDRSRVNPYMYESEISTGPVNNNQTAS